MRHKGEEKGPVAPFSFPWKGKPRAIVLDNDLLTRWLEAQRQINEEQALRDAAKERDEKELELKERVAGLESELVQASYQIEELNILALKSRNEIEQLEEELATLR